MSKDGILRPENLTNIGQGTAIRRSRFEVILMTAVLTIVFFIIVMFIDGRNIETTLGPIMMGIVPILLYLILSGAIQNIGLPGGSTVEFNDVIRETTIANGLTTGLSLQEFQPVLASISRVSTTEADLEMEYDDDFLVEDYFDLQLTEGRPTMLIFTLGHRIDPITVEEFIEINMKENPNFRNIVFYDQNDTFAGLMDVMDFISLLNFMSSDTLVEQLENGTILQSPRVIRGSIHQDTTYEEALATMDSLDQDTLAIVNEDELVVGTVKLENILKDVFIRMFAHV